MEKRSPSRVWCNTTTSLRACWFSGLWGRDCWCSAVASRSGVSQSGGIMASL